MLANFPDDRVIGIDAGGRQDRASEGDSGSGRLTLK